MLDNQTTSPATDTSGSTGALTEGGLGGLLDGVNTAATEQTGTGTSEGAHQQGGAQAESSVAPGQEAASSTQESARELFAWEKQLPADLRGLASLAKHSSLESLVRGYRELDGKLGKAIIPPGENASTEEVAAYWKALGAPVAANEYQIKFEGTPPPAEALAELATTMHGMHLTQEQAQQFVAYLEGNIKRGQEAGAQAQAQALEARKAAIVAGQKDLAATYGDKLEQKLALARRVVQATANPELEKAIRQSGLTENPAFVKFLVRMGEATREDQFVEGGTSSSDGEFHFKY